MSGKAARSVFFVATTAEASQASTGVGTYLEGTVYLFDGIPILTESEYRAFAESTVANCAEDQKIPGREWQKLDWFDWCIERIPPGDPNRRADWLSGEGWRAFPPERISVLIEKPNPRLVGRTLMALLIQIWDAEPKGVS